MEYWYAEVISKSGCLDQGRFNRRQERNMTQSKKRYRLLFTGLLLLLTVIPRDNARADVGVPPAPSATVAAADLTESDTAAESPSDNFSPSFSLIMGIGFIGTAIVLIVIAVKRRESNDSP